MEQALELIASRGTITESYEERNFLLRNLGYPNLLSFYLLDNQLTMMYKNNILAYPWDIRVLYVCPFSMVCQVEIYYQPIDTTLTYWMDIDTIAEAGLNPVVNREKGYAQDMAWMHKDQAVHVRESALMPPVILLGRERYPELEDHINYLLEVLYGVRGYEDMDGKLHYVATSHQIANAWRDAILAEAGRKMEKVLSSKRWYQYIDRIDRLKKLNIHTKPTELQVETTTKLIQTLAARL
jgi:hypothetical protein